MDAKKPFGVDLEEQLAKYKTKIEEARESARQKGPDYFDRWTEHPLWLLNIGGDTILLRRSVVYSANPPPATFDIHFGRTFEFFPEVTHPFIELPESLQMKSGESRTLVDLQFYDGKGENLLGYFLEKKQPQRALDFDWSTVAEEIMAVYETVVDAARAVEAIEAATDPASGRGPGAGFAHFLRRRIGRGEA